MSQVAKNRRAIEKQAQLKPSPAFNNIQAENEALLLLAVLVVGFIGILTSYGFI